MPAYFARRCMTFTFARIQRGNASFASKVLGARGALLSVLIHFFENGRWGSPVEQGVEGQRLTAEDQLFILMQAAHTSNDHARIAAPEQQICYERAESLCHSLNRPLLLLCGADRSVALFTVTGNLTATMKTCQTNLLAGAGAE